jgi:hypothetical protein
MTAAIAKTRGYARSLAATSVFTPSVVIRYIVGKVLGVGSTFGASIIPRFAWTRTLAASSTFTPSVGRSTLVGRSRSRYQARLARRCSGSSRSSGSIPQHSLESRASIRSSLASQPLTRCSVEVREHSLVSLAK